MVLYRQPTAVSKMESFIITFCRWDRPLVSFFIHFIGCKLIYSKLRVTAAAYKVFKIDSQGKGSLLAEITDAPPAYLHTIFVTKRYVGSCRPFFTHERLFFHSSSSSTVLVVWQADYKMGGLSIMINEAISVNTFAPWSEKRKTLFFVIDRQKGGVVGR
jgi:hypothetical protein